MSSVAIPRNLSPVEAILYVLETYGIVATIAFTIELEKDDPRMNSRLAQNPSFAFHTILLSLMDISEDMWRGIASGTLLLDCRGEFSDEWVKEVLEEDASQQYAASQATGSQDREEVARILDSKEELGNIFFKVQWENENESEWLPRENLDGCNFRIAEFYRRNPGKARCWLNFVEKRGPMQQIVKPDELSDADTNGYLIYAHYFVNCGEDRAVTYHPLRPEVLRTLIEKMEYYVSDPGNVEFQQKAHRMYTSKIDNQEEFKNSLDWSSDKNKQGYRKHLATSKDDPSPVQSRLSGIRDDLIPKLKEQLSRGESRLVEVGYTARPWRRREEHRSHIGTTAGLALIEEIAKFEFPNEKFEWRFVVLAECRRESDRLFLECYFHRFCQSYFHLGGFNSTMAGANTHITETLISDRHSVDLLNDMDFDQIAVNLAEDEAKLNILRSSIALSQRLEKFKTSIDKLESNLYTARVRLSERADNLRENQESIKKKIFDQIEADRKIMAHNTKKLEQLGERMEMMSLGKAYLEASKDRRGQ